MLLTILCSSGAPVPTHSTTARNTLTLHVNAAVELSSRDTAVIHSNERVLFACINKCIK